MKQRSVETNTSGTRTQGPEDEDIELEIGGDK